MKTEKRSFIKLDESGATTEERELDFNDEEEFEEEVERFSEMYNIYEEKKKSDLKDDIILFAGLFAITSCILGFFILSAKCIYRILK
jgi:hypothetical protein